MRTEPWARRVRRRLRSHRRPRFHQARPEQGVTLIETVVAMFILALVITATVPFFVSVLQSTSGLGERQVALNVASQQLEYVRSVDPTNLITGRNTADVAALIATPGLVNLTADVTSSGNSDPTAAAGSANAVVKPTITQVSSGTTFTIRTYVDVCYLSKSNGTCALSTLNGPAAYRVSVDVAWPARDGVNCPSGRAGYCEYVSSTLIDISYDPIFSNNLPPTIAGQNVTNNGTTSTLGTLHPQQQVTITLTGTNYAYGCIFYSGSYDTVSSQSNSGTTLTGTMVTSTTLGVRTLSVVNPDGSSATTSFTVATSAPTATSISPATFARNVSTTFTLAGTDFFATPTNAAATTKPTITLAGTATVLGSPVTISPTTSNITVSSPTSLTFKATFPTEATAYTTTGTLTLTDPDGGTTTKSYTMTVT